MIRQLLFDLDGTLTDPAEGITNSIAYALRKMDRPVPPYSLLTRFIGPPLIGSFRSFLGMTEEEALRALALYREYFAVTGLFENRPYDGIADALTGLRETGYRLYVATSKPEPYACRILEHFGLDGFFEMICGASMDERRVEKADVIRYAMERAGFGPAGSVMIGDRRHDIQGGREAGLLTVGVLWGYGSREELTEAGADRIAGAVGELADAVASVSGSGKGGAR